MAKKLKSKKSQVNPNLIDYYALFGLDRGLDNKNIVVELSKKLNIVRQKQTMCQSSEDITKLRELEEKIHEAINVFRKPDVREDYDKKLKEALAKGTLDTTAQQIAEDVYAEIQRMFDMNNYNGVIRKCQELISGTTAETRLYSYIVRSYYLTERYREALSTVDSCLSVHPNDFDALQMSARYYNMCNKDYQKAQNFVNRMLEMDPDSALAVAEQGYLYLCMGNKDMAFKAYEDYIDAHPTNEAFKESCAVDMINYSYSLFVEDEDGTALLISQESYEECLALAEKAASFYDDEDIKNHLEYTRQFGKIEFNEDNREAIRWFIISGLMYSLMCLPGFLFVSLGEPGGTLVVGIGLVLAFLMFFCAKKLRDVSYRPYWQIFRYEVTGYRDKKEKLYVTLGKIFTGYMRFGFKLSWSVFKGVFRFILPW